MDEKIDQHLLIANANDQADTKAKGKKKALSIVVIGASGDLAKKKTYPALFSLYSKGLIPKGIYQSSFSHIFSLFLI